MDGGVAVTFISVAMFLGCFLLGFTPLLFRLSEVRAFSFFFFFFFFLNSAVGTHVRHALSVPRTDLLPQESSFK